MLAFFGGGASPLHWIVIGVVALLLFGNRLPEVARSIGRAINEFKRGMREVNEEIDEPDTLPPPKSTDKLPSSAEKSTTVPRTGVSEPANPDDEAQQPR